MRISDWSSDVCSSDLETAICIVDETGGIVREARVATEVEAIDAYLSALGVELARVGLEPGPLSGWQYAGLRTAGWTAICDETRGMRAVNRRNAGQNVPSDTRAIARSEAGRGGKMGGT